MPRITAGPPLRSLMRRSSLLFSFLVALLGFVVALLVFTASAISVGATEEPAPAEATDAEADPVQEALDDQLREGAEVYSQVCSSCHQPGGAGLPGRYPPLVDNPHVDDADYVADVIMNGREGEIIVAGETYNGIMPSFSTLTDEETDAVIAYIQNDFAAPAAAIAEFESSGPVAGTELPALTNMSAYAVYLLAASVFGLVLAPRLLSQNSRLNTPWLDAWLKTAVIVLSVILLTVFLPDWALKTGAVSKLSRFAQDFIGSALWAIGLATVLGGLWYAHRESRV